MFGHTQGEIFKKTFKKEKKSIEGGEIHKTINFGGKLSFILSFIFPECCALQLLLHIFLMLM